MDDVEKDLKLMGINRWATIVTDRVNWRRISESALASTGLAPVKVLFIDYQAAILALSVTTPTDCLNTIHCRAKIAELISYDWTVALQWVPSHVGIPGNERADQKANQRAESSQSEVLLIIRRAKSLISTYIDKCTAVTQKPKSLGKT
ncbi:reverse transcriptase [Trichonephila clavipes]|nr:reverse transcriptase [Trichonephila clavipes]